MTVQNKGRENMADRAREIRDWMDGEIAAGRPVKEDDVWAKITTRYATLVTDAAEKLLHMSMDLPAAPSIARTAAMRGLVDRWVGSDGDLVVPADRLSEFIADAARATDSEDVSEPGPSSPGM